MSAATIIFTASENLGSLGIRAFDGGEASHCGVLIDGQVIDARWIKGVRSTPLEEWVADRVVIDTIDVPVRDLDAMRAFLDAQIGKGYDYSAILGFVIWRDWSNDGRWYCSELVMMALIVAGITLADRHRRVSVRMLREICHAHQFARGTKSVSSYTS